MRQIIGLIKDDHIHYAVVDDDEGTLIPFADIHLPEPDRFGLQEAALLGTNLIEAIGLNGKRPQPKAVAERSEQAISPVVVHEHRGKGDMRTPKRDDHSKVRLDDIVTIIDQHLEGVTARDIAQELWQTYWGYPGKAERWVARTVENRIHSATHSPKRQTPFRVTHRAVGNMKRKYMLPLTTPTTTQPQPTTTTDWTPTS